MTKFIILPLLDGSEHTINVRYIRQILKPLSPDQKHTHIKLVLNPDIYDQLTTTIPYDRLLHLLQQRGITVIADLPAPTI
jgi:hypothetical protein